ncbi:hypothetical protein SLE2022_398210 [Rubroshorea leprosula]
MGCPLNLRVSLFNGDNFASFLDHMAALLQKEQLEFLCVLCWQIWNSRNNALWNGRMPNPQIIIEQSLRFMDGYSRAIALRGRGTSTSQKRETRWSPPSEGHVKINVDGAVSSHKRIYGMGAVVRNNSGEVVVAMACKGQGAVGVEIAEACCMCKALQWACEFSFDRVMMESDCASLVTALNSGIAAINSGLGTVISDCKLLMAFILDCRVQHIRQEGNSVAHELARRALHAKDDEFWIVEFPPFIAHIVTGELP